MKGHWIWTACFLSTVPGLAAAEPELTHVDVFTSGADGYFAYRIPAIETAADGSLVALCEARKYNLSDPGFGKQDIDLACKRSTDGGRTWSAMQIVEDPGELWSAANPATVVDRTTGRLWVFYIRSKPERSSRTRSRFAPTWKERNESFSPCGGTFRDRKNKGADIERQRARREREGAPHPVRFGGWVSGQTFPDVPPKGASRDHRPGGPERFGGHIRGG